MLTSDLHLQGRGGRGCDDPGVGGSGVLGDSAAPISLEDGRGGKSGLYSSERINTTNAVHTGTAPMHL